MVFWTESGLRQLIEDVISGPAGAEATQRQVEKILRSNTVSKVGSELQGAAEHLAEKAKSSFHRKLNAIYTAQCDRLDAQLEKFVSDMDERVPYQELRLEALTKRLADVEALTKGWLKEPELQLKNLALERQKLFAEELSQASRKAVNRVKVANDKAEEKLSELIDSRLHALLIEAIQNHLLSAPLEKDSLSNKQIAALKRISLREVKRQRARGMR